MGRERRDAEQIIRKLGEVALESGRSRVRRDIVLLCLAVAHGLASERARSATTDIPGDPSTQATLAIGSSLAGEIDTAGDTDWYRIELTAGDRYVFTMLGLTLEDSFLALYDPDGVFLLANNDGGGTLDSALTFVAPSSDTYFLSAYRRKPSRLRRPGHTSSAYSWRPWSRRTPFQRIPVRRPGC